MGNTNICLQFNTLMYEVEYLNGEIRSYAVNVIADNVWSQVNLEGQRYVIFESIIDHYTNSSIAVSKENMYHYLNGQRTMRRSTAGVKLLVLCKD